MRRKFGEDGACSSGDMLADRQTDRHGHRNTRLRYRGRSKSLLIHVQLQSICTSLRGPKIILMPLKALHVFRPRRTHGVQRCSLLCVCVSVCRLDATVSPAKTDEPIEMLLELWPRVCPGNSVFDEARISSVKGQLLRGRPTDS